MLREVCLDELGEREPPCDPPLPPKPLQLTLERLTRVLDIAPYPLSHLAVRVADWDLYVHQRTLLERHASANRENVWNGRPISLIVLTEPLEVFDGTPVSRIELIPPVHQQRLPDGPRAPRRRR